MSVATAEMFQEVHPRTAPATVARWGREYKWPLLMIAALVLVLYSANFSELYSDWKSDENYSHGFAVPAVFLWMLWQRRNKLANAELSPRPWALVIVILALLQLAAGTWAAENFVAHSSLLVLLSGIALFLFGGETFRLVVFPIGWLTFMIPLPSIIFYEITFPLQLLASRLAVVILDLLHVPIVCEGNVLYLAHFTAGVAEACSGIRSLISVLAFAVLIGHLCKMRLLSRWILILVAIPAAVAMNAARIAGAGLAGNYLGVWWAEGFFHSLSGWLLFVCCLGLMFGLTQVLRRLEDVGVTKGSA